MSKPNLKAVPNHEREREPFITDAEREKLPLVNRHDDKGRPVLKVDEIIRRSERKADSK